MPSFTSALHTLVLSGVIQPGVVKACYLYGVTPGPGHVLRNDGPLGRALHPSVWLAIAPLAFVTVGLLPLYFRSHLRLIADCSQCWSSLFGLFFSIPARNTGTS
eukprot:9417150-Heterocapsa_arctica.AAC.1